MPSPSLIACAYCDALQREPAPRERGRVLCRRCGALLYRHRPAGIDGALALAIAAAALFALANAFPVVALELQGHRIGSTLYGAVRAMWNQDMQAVAALVFATAILFPALELGAMTYVLLPLRLGRPAPGSRLILRMLQSVRPWSMVEVFLLGLLVSLVKLAHVAHVQPGIGLWAFGALMLLLAAAAAAFDAREVWPRLGTGR